MTCSHRVRDRLTLPPCDAFLFDFDGTLAVLNLDFNDMRRRLYALAAAQGLAPKALQGRYILEMVEHATTLLSQHQPEVAATFYREAHQLLQEIEIEAAHKSTLLPGVPELLAVLQQRQIGVGIVTRNCAAAVRTIFPHLDQYCQAFLARDHVDHVKPHPAHLQAALTCLESIPGRTIMVGDGVLDIQAAKTLGMFAIGVLSGTSTRSGLLHQGADLVLESAAELLAYFPEQQGSNS